MRKNTCLVLLWLSLILTLSGCNFTQNQTGNKQNEYTKEKIQVLLSSNKGVLNITWSPDNKKVIYSENNASEQVYLWRVDEERARVVKGISPETDRFLWSPDSQYILIPEKQGEKFVNRIVKAETLAEQNYKIKSSSIPAWSPDSLSVVFSREQNIYGDKWGSLEVYTIGAEKSEYIWKARNTLYKVDEWDAKGNIAYTEVIAGKETKKTTKNIRASISGVYLGDHRDQVIAALGKDYKETVPNGEPGNFPEQVYTWTYDKGFKIFIGEKSGKVLEIMGTSPSAETNLGLKVGDTAEKVFATYRPHYIEPETINGGRVPGLFKVEGAAALYFMFDEKRTNASQDVKPEAKVERILLTYPEHMDDSF